MACGGFVRYVFCRATRIESSGTQAETVSNASRQESSPAVHYTQAETEGAGFGVIEQLRASLCINSAHVSSEA